MTSYPLVSSRYRDTLFYRVVHNLEEFMIARREIRRYTSRSSDSNSAYILAELRKREKDHLAKAHEIAELYGLDITKAVLVCTKRADQEPIPA